MVAHGKKAIYSRRREQERKLVDQSVIDEASAKGIEILSKIVTDESLASWYEECSRDHFWFKWRLRALVATLRSLECPFEKELRAIDVGCGPGLLREQLEGSTNWSVDGTDLCLQALLENPPLRGKTVYFDITDELPQFREWYDVLFLFDVIEHVEDTHRLLSAALKLLKPEGFLIINVPALPSLMSAYDEAAGHLRRYTKDSLAKSFSDLPLDVKALRYWGFTLVPLLFLRKLYLSMGKKSKEEIIKSGFKPPNGLMNSLLYSVGLVETSLLDEPPLGTSVLLAGQKKK